MGHDINEDIKFLSDTIDFDVSLTPSISAIVDTQQLARCVFSFRHKNISLEGTLSALGIKAKQLHNSGNDAVYALKAAIHLFCSYQEDTINQKKLRVGSPYRKQDELDKQIWQERLDYLRHVARHCPRQLSRQDVKIVAQPPRPPRVDNPDLFESDSSADGEAEGGMIAIFGDVT